MPKYDHKKIEKKWQEEWEKTGANSVTIDSNKKKFYTLIEFPYPSGDGLHAGHVRSYTALDIIARKRRAEGFNVLYPIGWDAFGLPTENYAIKTGIHPRDVTKTNTDTFRRQLKSLGISFDWSREINTTDPSYYKWTQWIFLKLLEKGLAYKAKTLINWCPSCKIGLANEEAAGGVCERCGGATEKREKEQWMLAITKYAERLLNNLDALDYTEPIKAQQRNWIGKSEGSEIDFAIKGSDEKVTVFTTRADTLFGATYVVLAPEHPLLEKLKSKIKNWNEVEKYKESARKKTEIERTAADKEKTGIELEGLSAINPGNNKEIPVWIADYVLPDYGTGAIMAVPAHDERDWEFATKFNLPIQEVVLPNIIDKRNPPVSGKKFVERENVHAIVKNPKTGKYLALKWNKYDWVTFPMGGVDAGEDIVSAAKREVKEETGFINLKLIKVLPGRARAEYFAKHKDENRISFTTAVLFELVDEEQVSISEEEKSDHEVFWLDEKNLNYETMTHAEVELWNDKLSSKSGAYTGEGILIDSEGFNGLSSEKAKKKITETVGGRLKTTYKLRDWVFSRQRYWGEPIPVVYCEKCGIVPLPESDLPLLLPEVKNYKPTDSGESPLATISDWVNTTCPKCSAPAKRETDVMPNWAGSSWYFLRYCDPKNDKELAGKDALSYFMPVDWYNGGMEHTTLHLLYSRFWNQFLFDIGIVPFEEPYKKRTSHGLILAEGGVKMSKSKGNVVNPDSIVEQFGADTLRLYEMFMGPFEDAIAWNSRDIIGPRKFIERVWDWVSGISQEESAPSAPHKYMLHKTIEKASNDIETLGFNTAVSQLMICFNEMKKGEVGKDDARIFIRLLAPFTPHVAEDLWALLEGKGSVHSALWPLAERSFLEQEITNIPVQIGGKVRDIIRIPREASEDEVKKIALSSVKVQKFLAGRLPERVIYISGKVINIVAD